MTVVNQQPIQEFIANGLITEFAINFASEGKGNLKVTANNETVTTNDYSYDKLSNSIVFSTAPIAGTSIMIQRTTSLDRSINYQTYDNSFRPEILNYDLDRIIRILQEQGYTDSILINDLAQEIYERSLQNAELKGQIENHTLNLATIQCIQQDEINKRIAGDQQVALDARAYTDFMLTMNNTTPSIFSGIADNIVITETGDTQRQLNDKSKVKLSRIVYLEDFGGSKTDFDPSDQESAAKAEAKENAKPYIGARQTALPMQTFKVWNYLDGFHDRGAVASIRNVGAFDSNEPRTEILGITNASGLGDYSDRDVAGLYVQVEGQPALHSSTATTFTATTVTCSDMSEKVKNFLKKDQVIDVLDGANKYSALILSVSGNTITIDTAWYTTDGSKTIGTPSNGSLIKIVPNTKIWATNFNAMLNPNSDAKNMVGIELGMFNNKYEGHTGYGYDMWSGGAHPINQAFQARGKYYAGLHLQGEYQFGVISEACNQVAFYDKGSPVGFLSQNSDIGVLVKNSTVYALDIQDTSGLSLTRISSEGAWNSLKYELSVISSEATIDQSSVVVFINPATNGLIVNLPNPTTNARRVIYVKNLSSTNTVFLAGVVEAGGGSYHLQTKETVQFICDGNTWFPISKHTI